MNSIQKRLQTQAAPRWTVAEHRVWAHADGRRASVFGAYPGPGFVLSTEGWTVYDRVSNTYGAGRPAFATKDEAQAFADSLNR